MENQRRRLLVHYHLFKNAGSSVDHLLKAAYGDHWVNHDPGDPPHLISANELVDFIDDNEHLRAMSSHMLVPPLPDCDVDVYPIVFLREPISRVMSAYLFEWKKQKQVSEPIGSLSEYLDDKFSNPRANAIEDFQCLRLGNRDPSRRNPDLKRSDTEILSDGKSFITSLPVFGLVDRFSESIARFGEQYSSFFPEVSFTSVNRNSTQDTAISLDERYQKILDQIGPTLFAELVQRNQLDIRLYEYACGLFDAAPTACVYSQEKDEVSQVMAAA